jgi:ABC-type ATPase with predicted acetyltransferase domain
MNKVFTHRSFEIVGGPKQHHDVPCDHDVAVFECPNCGHLIAKESAGRLDDRNQTEAVANTWWHGITM